MVVRGVAAQGGTRDDESYQLGSLRNSQRVRWCDLWNPVLSVIKQRFLNCMIILTAAAAARVQRETKSEAVVPQPVVWQLVSALMQHCLQKQSASTEGFDRLCALQTPLRVGKDPPWLCSIPCRNRSSDLQQRCLSITVM
jgi:hypothetical protein